MNGGHQALAFEIAPSRQTCRHSSQPTHWLAVIETSSVERSNTSAGQPVLIQRLQPVHAFGSISHLLANVRNSSMSAAVHFFSTQGQRATITLGSSSARAY